MRVVIAHAQPNTVQMVKHHLTKHGYDVEGILDGAEALAKVQANPPDILMCAYWLPSLNGADLLKSLRAEERFAATKIIFIYNRSSTPDDPWDDMVCSSYATLGADMCLGFPFNPAELLMFVNRLAEHIQAENENTAP